MTKQILIVIFLLLTSVSSYSQNESKTYDVIIIGAGVSGLTAANTLQDHGIKNYLILEARDRVGGRTWTITPWKNIPIDLGATFIHQASDKNPLMPLVKKWNIATKAVNPESAITYNALGEEIEDAVEAKDKNSYDNFKKYLQEKRKDSVKNALLSLSDVLLDFIHKDKINETNQAGLIFNVSNYIEQDYAADITNLSALWFDNDDDLGGKDLFLLNGYQGIVNRLADTVKEHVLLNQFVSKIDYQNKDQIAVTTSDGKSYLGNKVICTIPVGVLKKGKVQFIPQLPQEKLTALDHLNMGTLNKIIIKFPKVFWDKQQSINYIAPAHWDGKQWIDKGKWIEFENLNVFIQQPILLVFVSAQFAKTLENESDSQIIQEAMQVLRKIYKDKAVDPTAYVITRWGKDPFSEGSYSSLRPGALDDGEDYLNLAKTIEGRLLFAGEGTTDKYPATVYGAYLTGERAAMEIVNEKTGTGTN